MNCSLCKGKVEKTLLDKIVGTYLKRKKIIICNKCQKKLKDSDIEELKKNAK